MSKTACPSADELSAYLLGTLSKEAADRVNEHLDQCPDCEVTVADLEAAVKEDTLLSQLRRRGPADPYETDPACRAAVARAEELVSQFVAGAQGSLEVSETEATVVATLGEYLLLHKLGEGGMGTIYKALHTRLDRVVALKLLPAHRTSDGQRLARFEREMKAVGRLNHPNIVQAYDAREIDGTMVLVMEYVDGLDLSKIVSLCGPLTIADACELARQTALGLQYAHEQGLVHRDIKPSNLMLARASGGGEPSDSATDPSAATIRWPAATLKILDLGLALLRSETNRGEEVTTSRQIMGTLEYMAPEQVSDSHDVDIRADVYSLGCTLYRLLSGRPPFGGPQYKGPFDKMMARVRDAAPPISELRSDIPEELERVLDRMLAKAPEDRFATPAQAAHALGRFTRGCDLPGLLEGAREGAGSATETRQSLPVTGEPGRPVAIDVEAPVAPKPHAVALPAPRRWRPWTVAVGLMLSAVFFGAALEIIITISKNGRKTTAVVPEGSTVRISPDAKMDVELPSDGRRAVEVAARQARPPYALEARGRRKPFPPEEPGFGPWIDLLPMVDLNTDSVAGDWQQMGREITVATSAHRHRMMLPVKVRGNYDLEMEFTRAGGDGVVALLLPVASRRCLLGLSSHGGRCSGIADVDGKSIHENSSTREPGQLVNGQRYSLLARVRLFEKTAGVEVFLNGQPYTSWVGPRSSLDVPDGWDVPLFNTPGLGAGSCSVVFHKARLRTVPGEAQLLLAAANEPGLVPDADAILDTAHAPSALLAPLDVCDQNAEPDRGELDEWTDLMPLINTRRDLVEGKWRRTGEQVAVAPGRYSRLMLPAIVEGRYALEVEFTRTGGDDAVGLTLPVGSGACALLLNRTGYCGLERIDGWGANSNRTSRLHGTLTNGRRYHLLVSVWPEGDEASVLVYLDGEPYIEWAGKQSSLALPPRRELPQSDRPALAADYTAVTFHTVRLRSAAAKTYLIEPAIGGQQRKPQRERQRSPLSLKLPAERVELTAVQRCSKAIPGSEDRLLVQLGDITAGQVLLSIRSDDGEVILDDTSVKQGDVVKFSVGGRTYYIRVRELTNVLLGDDFGVFEVSSSPPPPTPENDAGEGKAES